MSKHHHQSINWRRKMNDLSQKDNVCLCQGPVPIQHKIVWPNFIFQDMNQFCAALFHGKKCYEWNIDIDLCINNDRCFRTVVYIVALLQRPDTPDYIVRYHNCFRGGTEQNIHAEQFLVEDEVIRHMDPTKPAQLTCYMTYQPCHLSGGHENMTSHRISCSLRLLRFVEQFPKLRLILRCAAIYRAHYTKPEGFYTPKQAVAFQSRVNLAREGIQMLQAHPRIELQSFRKKDWAFMLHITKERTSIGNDFWKKRYEYDRCIQYLFNQLKD